LTFDRTLFDEMSFQTLWSEGLMAARLVAMSACKPTFRDSLSCRREAKLTVGLIIIGRRGTQRPPIECQDGTACQVLFCAAPMDDRLQIEPDAVWAGALKRPSG
jgi:hypothetical protein